LTVASVGLQYNNRKVEKSLSTGIFSFLLQACENGRGAILLSVARGKVSEGIDFGNSIVN